jgi:predicted nucleotidyltransferase
MALLEREELIAALQRLGELAQARGEQIELVVVGGAAMVLGFSARSSTQDVDAVAIPASLTSLVRELARQVAQERGWPEDWLNDAAKGYLVGLSAGPVLLTAPGIECVLLRRLNFWQ